MSELLTLDQVAEQLHVSRRTVERLVKSRQLRPVRIGRCVRVAPKELEAYVAAAFRAA